MSSAAAEDLVSVVMIFRDAERFFDEAIASVLGQTHPRLELLLCDDGSSDSSTATAKAWAADQPDRVRYLEHPGHVHRGMSATRNLGIDAADGEFVAFLDADDVWEAGHLTHELDLLRAHPEVDLVCGRALDWYSWSSSATPDALSPLPWPAGSVVEPPLMLAAVLRRGAFSTPTCSLLVRLAALRQVGGGEKEFTTMFEDQVLLAKLYLTHTCVISGATSARYRRHAWSSSAVAERAGTYRPDGPNASYEAYLRWLSDRPEIQAPGAAYVEVLELLSRALSANEPGWVRPASLAGRVRRSIPPQARGLVRRGLMRAASQVPLSRIWPLRRLAPLSRQFGYDRGQPVDRYYIESFLAAHAHLIAGRVLEVGDASYTRRFGGSRVTHSDVLNIDPAIPETTVVADLADAGQLADASFDCLIVTQTLHLIWDLPAAVATLHRILRPGGTLLLTVPGITPISTDRWADTWYWALTPHSARRLFEEAFGDGTVEVETRGNVFAAVAFLEGLASAELRPGELGTIDPQFPVLVSVRADRSCES